VQRGHAIALRGAHFGALLQESQNRRAIAGLCGIGDGRIRLRAPS
jgi:hypothetical protein